MRLISTSILLTIFALSGCSSAPQSDSSTATAPGSSARSSSAEATAQTNSSSSGTDATVQTTAAATDRKIIRNAELTLELDAPADGGRRIAQLAEQHGGYIASTETRGRGGDDQEMATSNMIVTVEIRVPGAQFETVLNQVRGVGSRVRAEKTGGKDVTEEYIDLEARIRTKRALEAQFLEIMKGARTVADALEVQRQLADVRTDVERLEGRRRYLENQVSLSTIRVTLQTAAPLIATQGFFQSVKRALGDGIDIAATIALVLIRVIIALVPVVLLVFLPIGLLLRFLLRRHARHRLASKLEVNQET